MRNYTAEELNQLNIYELRFIAREKSVKSPTIKNREEIIKSIISAQLEENENFGIQNLFLERKSKPFDLIKPQDKNVSLQDYELANADWDNPYGVLIFKSSTTVYNSPQDVPLKISGYFAQSQMGYCLLGFENPLYVEMIATVPTLLAKKHGLEIGDFCEVEAKKVYNLELPIVQTIEKVNNSDFNINNRKIFDNYKAVFKKKPIVKDGTQLTIDEKPINYASRILYTKTDETDLDALLEEFNGIENTEVVLNLLCSTSEIIYKYMCLKKATLFFSLFTDSYIKQKFLYDLTLAYCKNQATNGKNVILIVNSLSKLNTLAERQQFEINYQDEPMLIKEFFELSRVLRGSGSITTIGAMQEDEKYILNKIHDKIEIEIN